LQLDIIAGTVVPASPRGDQEGVTLASALAIFLRKRFQRLTQHVVLLGTIMTPVEMRLDRLQGVADSLSEKWCAW